jgi:flagellar FliJ protein
MKNATLHTLIEIAQKASDDAAKKLGHTIQAKTDAENQLNLLSQYRQDYEDRFKVGTEKGLNVTQFKNFQKFIGKLDQAVDGQKRLIQDAEYKVDIARKLWQEAEKKRLSYQTLKDRNNLIELKNESKRDQKQTDEHATRSYFYKQ